MADKEESGGVPILKPAEVAELLSEWGLNISMEEVNKPSVHTVQAIYDQYLFEMLNLRLDDLDQPREIIMSDMEYPDLYTEAMKFRMFFHLTRHILNRAGVDHFSIQDVARPDGARLRKIISIIRNLLAFRGERGDFMASMVRKMDEAKLQEEELLAMEDQLKQEKEELLRQLAAEEAQVPEINQRIGSLKRRLDQEFKVRDEVVKKYDFAKRQAINTRDRYTAVTAELASTRQRNKGESSRLVNSPDRLRRTIANLAANVEQEKAALEQNHARARDYQAKLSQLATIDKDFLTAEETLMNIQEEQAKLDLCMRDLHAVKDAHNKRLIEHRELTTRAEQLERQIANAIEKFKRVQIMSNEKREASMQKMEMLREKFAQVDEQRNGMIAEHDLLRQDIASLEKDAAEYIKENEKILTDLMAEYWALRHDVDNYMATLATKFDLKIDLASFPALARHQQKKRKAKQSTATH